MGEDPKTVNHEEYNRNQNEQSPQSFANTESDQVSKVNPVMKHQKEEIMILLNYKSIPVDPKPVDNPSSESITQSTHDTNNDFESNSMGEDPKTVNHEEYNRNQNEQSPESFANTEVEQVSKVNPVGETQKEENNRFS